MATPVVATTFGNYGAVVHRRHPIVVPKYVPPVSVYEPVVATLFQPGLTRYKHGREQRMVSSSKVVYGGEVREIQTGASYMQRPGGFYRARSAPNSGVSREIVNAPNVYCAK